MIDVITWIHSVLPILQGRCSESLFIGKLYEIQREWKIKEDKTPIRSHGLEMEGPGLESVSKFCALGMRGTVKWKKMMSMLQGNLFCFHHFWEVNSSNNSPFDALRKQKALGKFYLKEWWWRASFKVEVIVTRNRGGTDNIFTNLWDIRGQGGGERGGQWSVKWGWRHRRGHGEDLRP